MKSKILTFCLMAPLALLFGCGEAGIETNISKKIEKELTVNQDSKRSPFLTFPEAITNVVEIDPSADEFAEYTADLDQYILNSIEIQILSIESNIPFVLQYFGFGPIPSADAVLEAENIWATGNDYSSAKELAFYNSLTNDARELTAGEPILIYDADNRDADVFFWDGTPPEKVTNFVQGLLDGQRSYFWAGLWADDYPSDFEIKLKFTIDLTARTQGD